MYPDGVDECRWRAARDQEMREIFHYLFRRMILHDIFNIHLWTEPQSNMLAYCEYCYKDKKQRGTLVAQQPDRRRALVVGEVDR